MERKSTSSLYCRVMPRAGDGRTLDDDLLKRVVPLDPSFGVIPSADGLRPPFLLLDTSGLTGGFIRAVSPQRTFLPSHRRSPICRVSLSFGSIPFPDGSWYTKHVRSCNLPIVSIRMTEWFHWAE